MRGAVDLLELPNRDVRVHLRCFQFGMPEHRLDETDIGAAFEHQCGHRVTPQVAGSAFGDAGGLDIAADQLGQIIESERFAGIGEKHRAVVRFGSQVRTDIQDVLVDPERGAIAEGNDAILPALTLADHHRSTLHGEIPQLDVGEFGPPHSRGVKHLENRVVPQAKRLMDLGLRQDLLSFRRSGGLKLRLNAGMIVRLASALETTTDALLQPEGKASPLRRKPSLRVQRCMEQIEKLPAHQQNHLLKTIDGFLKGVSR